MDAPAQFDVVLVVPTNEVTVVLPIIRQAQTYAGLETLGTYAGLEGKSYGALEVVS